MTTAFQNVIDKAESISINRRRKVAQTVSRDGTVKSTSLGGQIYEFEVQLPSGPSYTEYRPIIEQIEALDRVTVAQIQINNPGHNYISQYQGNLFNLVGLSVIGFSNGTTQIRGNQMLNQTPLSGFYFKSGDFIQVISTKRIYNIVNDMPVPDPPQGGANCVLNRPFTETINVEHAIRVGPAVVWDVICVQFPKWTIFARDQIQWDGPFVFAEAI